MDNEHVSPVVTISGDRSVSSFESCDIPVDMGALYSPVSLGSYSGTTPATSLSSSCRSRLEITVKAATAITSRSHAPSAGTFTSTTCVVTTSMTRIAAVYD